MRQRTAIEQDLVDHLNGSDHPDQAVTDQLLDEWLDTTEPLRPSQVLAGDKAGR